MLYNREYHAVLTPREFEVLELLANGYSAKEAADHLSIAPRTVERHTENARLKIGARNRVHMVTQAVARGILEIPREPLEDVVPPQRAFANGAGPHVRPAIPLK